jgi:4-amino-4-deoxy-L-arabinose transferase-like glycosyltransferase
MKRLVKLLTHRIFSLPKRLLPWHAVLLGAITLTQILILTHPVDAIVSFDEGFHGGAALFLSEAIHAFLGKSRFIPNPTYIYHEFSNGLVLYPHLWTFVAAPLGFLFGAHTNIFRFATSLFYVASIMLCYWFIRQVTHKEKPAIITTSIMATIPMVMIYSHLMMLEVPLLLCVSAMVMTFYLYALGILARTKKNILLISLVFLLAPHAKLPALPLAWTINSIFAVIGSLLFWKQRYYRHFLKPELGLFLILSIISLSLFILFENRYFHTNLIRFFMDQSQGISNTHKNNSLLEFLTIAYEHRNFYLRDFRHIPLLSIIWFGSVVIYFIWKRTPLSLLIVLWTLITYIAFSGVNPQVPQYLLPIYMPLAIASGMLISDTTDQFIKGTNNQLVTLGVTGVLILAQIIALPKSEGYGWRTKITGQESASRYIAEHAQFGDRVLSWYDGSTFAIRSNALEKFVPITNAVQQVCPQAMKDSYEWAVTLDEPPLISLKDSSILTQPPWEKVSLPNSKGTILYHNKTPKDRFVIEAEDFSPARLKADAAANSGSALLIMHSDQQPAFWGCFRVLPYGKQGAEFRLRTLELDNSIPDNQTVLLIEYADYPFGQQTGKRTISAKELRQSQGYQNFGFSLNQTHINQQGEFRLFASQPVTILLDSVTVSKTD